MGRFAKFGFVLTILAAPIAAAEPTSTAAARKLDGLVKGASGVRVDDAIFFRRTWIDLSGRIPAPEDIREFLKDPDPNKRQKLVDRMLAGDEFGQHWSRILVAMLIGARPIRQEEYDGRTFREFLQEQLAADRPYDETVREMITVTGSMDTLGASNFLLHFDADPEKLSGGIGKAFLGISLQCAQCHDHPHARWKQEEFRGLAAFFGKTRRFENGDDDDYRYAIMDIRKGEFRVPDMNAKPNEDGERPKKNVAAKFLDAKAPSGSRREALAQWLTAPQNPYFARHFVNQTWKRIFSKPMLDDLDDVGAETSESPALDLLAKDFVASRYSVKTLLRTIVLSETYQLAIGAKAIGSDGRFIAFPARPLDADELFRSVVQATGYSGYSDDQDDSVDDDDAYTDPPVEAFTERALSTQRLLILLNSDQIKEATQSGARIVRALHGRKASPQHVERILLSTVSRLPSDDEAKRFAKLLKETKGSAGLEDVFWIALNSAEFNTNH